MLASQPISPSRQPEESQNDLRPIALAVAHSASNEKMDRHLQEWQDMKPDIARLVALEGEVRELIQQLKSVNAQAIQNSTTNASADAKPQKPLTNGENMYAIQLFSLTDKKIMPHTWNSLSTKHPIMLGNLSPIYEEVSMQGKTYYRVKA